MFIFWFEGVDFFSPQVFYCGDALCYLNRKLNMQQFLACLDSVIASQIISAHFSSHSRGPSASRIVLRSQTRICYQLQLVNRTGYCLRSGARGVTGNSIQNLEALG